MIEIIDMIKTILEDGNLNLVLFTVEVKCLLEHA